MSDQRQNRATSAFFVAFVCVATSIAILFGLAMATLAVGVMFYSVWLMHVIREPRETQKGTRAHYADLTDLN